MNKIIPKKPKLLSDSMGLGGATKGDISGSICNQLFPVWVLPLLFIIVISGLAWLIYTMLDVIST